MSIQKPIEFDLSEFQRQFEQLVRYSQRDAREEFLTQCKGLMRYVADITPPAHGKGTRGKARKMGQSKIAADLIGGRGSGRRAGIFTVVSDSLMDLAVLNDGPSDTVKLWTRSDGSVYGTQQQHFRPDATMGEMRAHHKAHFRGGKMRGVSSYDKTEGRFTWIEQMVVRASTFEKYLGTQKRKVGFYAAAFRPSMQGLGLPVPSYMKGHTPKGLFTLNMDDGMMSMEGVNLAGYGPIDQDLQKRIRWAIGAQTRAIERQLPHVIRRYEKLVN